MSKFDPRDPRLAFAIALVRDCCRLAVRIQEAMVGVSLEKADRSPVTVADYAIQALAGCRLARAYPGETLVAEEASGALRAEGSEAISSAVVEFVADIEPAAGFEEVLGWIDRGQSEPTGPFWVLDPVDGTKGFLRNDQYAIALALVEHGRTSLAVLGCPRLEPVGPRERIRVGAAKLGSLLAAVRNGGTWQCSLGGGDFSRMMVSDVSEPAEAVMIRSVESGHTNLDQIEEIRARLGVRQKSLAVDSQAKYALLAGGQGDVLIRLLSPSKPDYREKIWDQAPGALILEEAGGRITDLDGCDLDFTAGRRLERNRGVLATNSKLHGAFLDALSEL